jgi:choline dehydrogenase-like flavoprotein
MNRTNDDSWDLASGVGAAATMVAAARAQPMADLRGCLVADCSIVPRITTGNTMAPCVVIGERAADAIRAEHRLRESHRNGRSA